MSLAVIGLISNQHITSNTRTATYPELSAAFRLVPRFHGFREGPWERAEKRLGVPANCHLLDILFPQHTMVVAPAVLILVVIVVVIVVVVMVVVVMTVVKVVVMVVVMVVVVVIVVVMVVMVLVVVMVVMVLVAVMRVTLVMEDMVATDVASVFLSLAFSKT